MWYTLYVITCNLMSSLNWCFYNDLFVIHHWYGFASSMIPGRHYVHLSVRKLYLFIMFLSPSYTILIIAINRLFYKIISSFWQNIHVVMIHDYVFILWLEIRLTKKTQHHIIACAFLSICIFCIFRLGHYDHFVFVGLSSFGFVPWLENRLLPLIDSLEEL